MAGVLWSLALSLIGIFAISSAQTLIDELINDNLGCEESCRGTFPLHTYDKATHLGFCERGCRLFNIIDFVNEDENLNNTHDACTRSCKEAHESQDDQDACLVGCGGQMPFAERRRKEQQKEVEDLQMQMLYPLLYVHNIYSNMVDKLSHHMSVSWTYYTQGENGQLVVIKSEPRYFVEFSEGDENGEYKTSNYIETNLETVDNSATPNVKSSQLYPQDYPPVYGANAAAAEVQKSDWLGCIAKKTGLPRLVLSFTMFVSLMIMLWLCVFTAVVPQEKKLQPQKLSIYGDLEYLTELNADQVVTKSHPQEKQEAAPLPIKIKVERI